jgi:hypothetical protein
LEGLLMSVESLTYADLADRLGTTQEAARSLVRRLRLPRQTGNDGKVRINIDFAEIKYKRQPARSPIALAVDDMVGRVRAARNVQPDQCVA